MPTIGTKTSTGPKKSAKKASAAKKTSGTKKTSAAKKNPAAKKASAAKKTSAANKPAPARMPLAAAMTALEHAGSEQTRKTYRRHGALDPMFGVSFATLKTLVKRIGVDHELALSLWKTGNHDARTLAVKIADPQAMSAKDLDAWAGRGRGRMCGGYVAMLAAEGPHAQAKVRAWLEDPVEVTRCVGWRLVAQLAIHDETTPDKWFIDKVRQIAASIHEAPNDEREAMNGALIGLGGRSPALRRAVAAAAKKIGKVEVDHGDTACKTPDAGSSVEKMWAYAAAKNFASPAAQERAREPQRTRC
jgi:3-methyladenine DNA glycosylase AlkD